ncbi:MAG TPA: tRNA (uridine(34)/cytosine(34)/5-carboxymethylaminomethyluridine(34)-2'-O)-methyltransferase TrmL [Leucothrix sp.]|nr:tRNA (uridine(34)/cytosine(34)/5-carboxymethylaminomethyluridine(34)-2'-O)-methyltransferase TrmL [Leucothrix sp.]HIQ15749.1 tRNA (uridine(34)/cytosine(34)/5-carboxymethylaminomethyluridine(34)-2'-O)-methyltransferase TrmL [Leucothrix sp.]
MFEIALYEPEIPPNTGNIMRLCANTGCSLHLIHPLGFDLDEKKLRRAGMDYRDMATVKEHKNIDAFFVAMREAGDKTLYALTTKAQSNYSKANFNVGDILLFGPETRGLPAEVLDKLKDFQKLRLPMLGDSRSLNLSNTVAITVYEALRQHDFMGLE